MQTPEELKQGYNKLLKTYRKAEIYMDNQNVPVSEREQHLEKFSKIIDGLNGYIKLFKAEKIEYSDEDLLEGFKI